MLWKHFLFAELLLEKGNQKNLHFDHRCHAWQNEFVFEIFSQDLRGWLWTWRSQRAGHKWLNYGTINLERIVFKTNTIPVAMLAVFCHRQGFKLFFYFSLRIVTIFSPILSKTFLLASKMKTSMYFVLLFKNLRRCVVDFFHVPCPASLQMIIHSWLFHVAAAGMNSEFLSKLIHTFSVSEEDDQTCCQDLSFSAWTVEGPSGCSFCNFFWPLIAGEDVQLKLVLDVPWMEELKNATDPASLRLHLGLQQTVRWLSHISFLWRNLRKFMCSNFQFVQIMAFILINVKGKEWENPCVLEMWYFFRQVARLYNRLSLDITVALTFFQQVKLSALKSQTLFSRKKKPDFVFLLKRFIHSGVRCALQFPQIPTRNFVTQDVLSSTKSQKGHRLTQVC